MIVQQHLKRVHRRLLASAQYSYQLWRRKSHLQEGDLPGSNSFTSYCPYLPPAFVTDIYKNCWDKKIPSKNIYPPLPSLGRLTMDPSMT